MKTIFATLAGLAAAADITVTCNNDNTISVNLPYDRTADILELSYGTCGKDDVRGADAQNSDNGWDLTFDVGACGMDSKLRTIDYEQKATVRVGRSDGGTELTMANFDIDSWCSYTATYTVKFDYGNLTTEAHSFDASGGLIGLNFEIHSYNSDFNETASAPSQGGETIHLGLTVTNTGFNHAGSWVATSGKIFAPSSCAVSDVNNNLTYTIFDTSSSCENDDVDLSIGYKADTHMWTIEHTLFLLGSYRSSSFELSCDVIVCETSGDASACTAISTACL